MNLEEYRKASNKGRKYFRACVSKGMYPYLQVLDDILEAVDIASTVDLGVVSIPTDQIAGTKTEGRKAAFAGNFMPLLDEETEFAYKWETLCNSHLEEGIRDPILAYEYLNRFYVQEGNKRVSVLKYFDSPSIKGKVLRLVPKRSETKENHIYYEFMDFYQLTGVNYLYFSEEGRFAQFVKQTGKQPGQKWDHDDCSYLFSVYQRFKEAFYSKGGQKLPITVGDALLAYLKVYSYQEALEKSVANFKEDLGKIWIEIMALLEEQVVELSMEPEKTSNQKMSLLDKLFSNDVMRIQVGFVHEKNAQNSSWTYAHEFGRHQLEDTFPGRVTTRCYDNVKAGVDDEKAIQQAIDDGCDVIFTTTPKLMSTSLKMAVKNPKVKILNCSLNMPHPYIRTYYGRIHEAKFLVGAIAGALVEDNKIGYVATYPTFGMTAGINAFALGAKMVNPRAKVYLEWTAVKGIDVDEDFRRLGVHLVSSQDMRIPNSSSKKYGLYQILDNGEYQDIAMPFWHWGEFYVKIIKSVLDGNWEGEDDTPDARALNYWWGLSSGTVDVLYSRSLPVETRRLVELLRQSICNGSFSVFSGKLLAQNDRIIQENGTLTPEEIIHMDWLASNVVGEIPRMDELIEEAKPLVQLQGVNKQDTAARIL